MSFAVMTTLLIIRMCAFLMRRVVSWGLLSGYSVHRWANLGRNKGPRMVAASSTTIWDLLNAIDFMRHYNFNDLRMVRKGGF
ncbi:MAG: hypothetical protein R1F54_01930 [Candidatus Zeuxoniibacter abyssi]|nr:MAG: hypothetical protein R1F54_01930 [Candidatus Persebacteraceae bacterium AB1(2)]